MRMTNYDAKTDTFGKRMLVMLTFFGFGLITLYIAQRIGHYLFLVSLYGHARVSSEHLHFVEMIKGRPWVISNGDKISVEGSQASFPYVFGSWFVIILPMYPFIYLFLTRFIPKPKKD